MLSTGLYSFVNSSFPHETLKRNGIMQVIERLAKLRIGGNFKLRTAPFNLRIDKYK